MNIIYNRNVMRKNRILNCFVFCIVILHLTSCNNTNKVSFLGVAILNAKSFEIKQQNLAITIDVDKVDEIGLIDMIQKIKPNRFIQLSNKELIGDIDKILIAQEKIYVLDAFSTERVLIYDFNGSLIGKIESKGQGPKEYGGLDDMFFDKKNKNLILNDRLMPKLLYYTNGGKFIKKTVGIPSTQFALSNKTIFLKMTFAQSFEKNVNYGLISFENDSIISKGFELSPSQKSIPATKSLTVNYLDELLFTPNGSDTVYHIIDKFKYQVKYIIKHKKSIWDFIRSNDSQQFTYDKYISLIIDDNYSCFSGEIFENNNFLSFIINKKPIGSVKSPHAKPYFYNKSNKQLFALKPFKETEIDDKELRKIGTIIPPPPIYVHNNDFVSILNPRYILHLKQGIAKNKISIKNEELRKMIIDFPEDGNPILMFYSIN